MLWGSMVELATPTLTPSHSAGLAFGVLKHGLVSFVVWFDNQKTQTEQGEQWRDDHQMSIDLGNALKSTRPKLSS